MLQKPWLENNFRLEVEKWKFHQLTQEKQHDTTAQEDWR